MWQTVYSVRALSRAAVFTASLLTVLACEAGNYDPPPAGDTIPERIRPFAEFISDVADRSRRVIYTPYPVSAQHGVVRNFVHVSDGSAVLARTDLVVDAALPIVFRRAYHSQRTESRDFGASGWHLTLAERIERDRRSGAMRYMYGNGAVLDLGKDGQVQSALQTYLSDIADVRIKNDAAIRVTTRTGIRKDFAFSGGVFLLTTVTDAYDNRLDLRYSSHGQLRRVDSSDGRWLQIDRDKQGRIRTAHDSNQRAIQYAYDDLGRLAGMTDPGEHTWQYSYDGGNRLASTSTPNGYVDVEFKYDALGRVSASRAHGVRANFKYADARRTAATDKVGLVTTYSAAPSGLTTDVRNGLGIKTELQLNESGLPEALLRNDVRIAHFASNPSDRGRIGAATLLDPVTNETYDVRYDAQGRVIAVASSSGTKSYEVEGYGSRLIAERVVFSDGSSEEAKFDSRGELERLVKRDGSALTFVRDGDRLKIGDGTPRKVELRFNSRGQLRTADTPDGITLRFSYNDLGLRESTEASYGAIVRYQYDASGSLFYSQSGFANAEQVPAQTYIFGIDHRIDEVRGSGGDRHQYVYGPAGELLTLRSSVLSRDTLFSYDTMGRLTQVEYEGKVVKYYYAPGEADIAARAAIRALPVFNQQREISDFPSRFEAGLTRIRASTMGLLTYDDVKHELVVAADPARWNPAAPLTRSISALRVETLLKDKIEGLQAFTIPSNRLFVPREYESVNCCICMCGGFTCLPE